MKINNTTQSATSCSYCSDLNAKTMNDAQGHRTSKGKVKLQKLCLLPGNLI